MTIHAVLGAPFTGRAWRATAHAATGCLVGVVTCTVLAVLGALTAGFGITGLLGVPFLAALLRCNRLFTGWQRARFAGCLGATLPAAPARPDAPTRLARLLAEARRRATWRAVGYHLLAGLTGPVGFLAVMAFWTAATTLTTVAGYAWTLPERNLFGWQMHDPVVLTLLTISGLAAFFAAPWVATGVATLDRHTAGVSFGPTRAERLDHRVRSLTASRAGLVDATDVERRRLERDLHDGVQQRLTSLAVNLGVARETLTDVQAPAHEAIVRAHEEVKEALSELRDLVRGLHPAVLDARGLDAALSAIVARSRVPVKLQVDVAQRPSPTIEAVAYFTVAEALTNVTKHAAATQVEITVRQVGDHLHLLVTDDGKGGACPDAGTGLRGLGQRIASVDGVIDIVSPAGSGTRIAVELPCRI